MSIYRQLTDLAALTLDDYVTVNVLINLIEPFVSNHARDSC